MKKKGLIICLFLISILSYSMTGFSQDTIKKFQAKNIKELALKEEIQLEVYLGKNKEFDVEKYRKIGESLQMLYMQGAKISKYYYPDKYFQDGESWSDDEMETCEETIGDVGCALTSFSMLVSLYGYNDDPGEVNNMMGDDACPFSWNQAEENYSLPACQYNSSVLSNSTATDTIAGILEEENVCIVGLKRYGSKHFVLARGYRMSLSGTDVKIYDPSSYNDFSYLEDYFDEGYSVCRLIYYAD